MRLPILGDLAKCPHSKSIDSLVCEILDCDIGEADDNEGSGSSYVFASSGTFTSSGTMVSSTTRVTSSTLDEAVRFQQYEITKAKQYILSAILIEFVFVWT